MPGRLEWKDEYSVGVAMIDAQHQMFISIINELYSAITAKRDEDILEGIFQQLVAYTQFHFQTEERYFDEFQYEEAAIHKAAHKALTDRVIELHGQKRALADDPFKLMDFLEDWLIEHIIGMDKRYTKCFNEHGLN